MLPAATPQATYVAAAPRDDRHFRVWSAAFDACDEFDFADLSSPPATAFWGAYVRGVVWALLDAGLDIRGFDAAVVGDLCIGVGIGSSASFEVAVALAAIATSGGTCDPTELALLCQRAENEFVGVRCGILDQFASMFGQAGSALLIDCRSQDITPIPLGGKDVAFIVCDTRKPRGLVESEYNARRSQCERAAQTLGVAALRDVVLEHVERHRDRLGEEAFRRARHVVTENQRVLDGAEALKRGDFAELGRLMRIAHESLRDDYSVSCRELDEMVEIACATEGCFGARLMGAGFGGSALAVVTASQARAFCRTVESRYRDRTGIEGKTFVTWPYKGAGLITPPELR